MKYITKQDEKDLIPYNIDIALAETKGLASNGSLKEEYFLVQSKYYYYLGLYLNKALPIDTAERELEKVGQKKLEEKDMDIYQYLSSNPFFYIRNTLYIERLSKECLQYFLLHNDEEVLDPQMEQIISSTYKEIIAYRNFDNETFEISYGPISPSYNALNTSLVLGIRFREENSDDYPTEDEWFEDYCNRREVVENIKEEFENNASQVLNCDVKVIEYFQESIKKKNNNDVIQK